jgi:Skp family chaperone for outer membrane proteins
MNSDRVTTESASFFVPICLGVVTQMFCAGLVTAVTVIGFPSRSTMNSESQTPDLVINDQMNSAESSAAPQVAAPLSDPAVVENTEPAAVAESIDDASMATDGNATAKTDVAPPNSPEVAVADTPPADAIATADTPPVAAPERPLNDVRTRSRLLKIAGEGIPDAVELCVISVTDVAQVNLELIGEEFSEPQPVTIQLDRQPVDGNSCTWNVKQIAASGFDRTQEVGVFSLTNQQFGFRWLKNANKGKLPFCKLKISANSDSEVCDLWSPVRAAAMKVSFNNATQKMPPFVPPGVQLPPAETLRLKLTLEGWPEHELSADTLRLNQTVEITIPQEDVDQNLLKMQLTLKADGGQLALTSSHFTSVPKTSSRKVRGEVEIDVKFEEKPISHSESEKLNKNIGREAAKYQKELETIDKDLEKLQTTLDNLDEQLQSGFRQDLAAQQSLLENRQSELEGKRTAAEELSNVHSAANDAMMKLAGLCEEIEGSGRIHFELVRPLSADDGGTNVVVSSSVNVNAAQPVGEVQ